MKKKSIFKTIKEKDPKFIELTKLVQKWAIDRGLHQTDPKKQAQKTQEEVGELLLALGASDDKEIVDAIGDVVVTLIILCMQLDLDLTECLDVAWNVIKDRKGKLINGKFVKEEDL